VLKMIETFSGIGSQAQALKNLEIDHKVVAIAEWDINAMYAYDILHNGEQDIKSLRHHTKESLIKFLSKHNLSSNGKNPISLKALKSMSIAQLKAIYISIKRNNNLVDISEIHAQDLPDADILTYSFPCQDLSISGYWHNNTSGIDRDAENRSTLLWEIERILQEYVASQKKLPRFLLMENVSNILSKRHIGNFNEWKEFLCNIGYINKVYTLDARNFVVPQSTVTTKQDRNPNSGIIKYDKNNYLVKRNIYYRNLTPRECFMLMGFKEEQYELLLSNNFMNKKGTMFLTPSKLNKMAGNSIVVPILEKIFEQLEDIRKELSSLTKSEL